MSVRLSALSFCALLCVPALASAGPIQFTLGTGNLTTSSYAPQLGMALTPAQTAGQVFSADLDSTKPLTLGVVAYEPGRISTPDPRDVHPDGTTHWNNDGYFGIDVTLTDAASGEVAVLHFEGRAHMYSQYSTSDGWTGRTDFWFMDQQSVTLGGNLYTVRGGNWYSSNQAEVNVWVGAGAPVTTPEPQTLALAALGLAPFGLRHLRRVW